MPGTFGILDVGRRGLMANRLAMNVTSHNIANATTPGYSRQRAELAATLPMMNAQGLFIGTGVSVEHVNRLRDKFADVQFRQASASLGSATLRHGALSRIEAALNEPGDNGLQAAMNAFFNSFQELASHPEEAGPRSAVLRQGVRLAETFNRLSTDFTQQRTNLADDAANKVTSINMLTRQIADLNRQITQARGAGNEPGDLMDQRDAAIDQLSQLVNVSAAQDSNGSMIVSIGGMQVVGNGSSVTLQSSLVGGTLQISTTGGLAIQVTGGELGGMLEMHNTTIPGYLAQLDSLASAVIARVNAVHSAGYGIGTPPPTGIAFFTGTDAATMRVSTPISSNINNIAASSNGQPGNNQNALALFGIAEERLMSGNTLTLAQYYGRFVSDIGSAVTTASGSVTGAELVLAQLDAQRQAVSGVSLDEEMTNMIKFQRSYEAAARVIRTADEMFETILSMV
jgi:flagellar hook-associated protein 1 FlgK